MLSETMTQRLKHYAEHILGYQASPPIIRPTPEQLETALRNSERLAEPLRRFFLSMYDLSRSGAIAHKLSKLQPAQKALLRAFTVTPAFARIRTRKFGQDTETVQRNGSHVRCNLSHPIWTSEPPVAVLVGRSGVDARDLIPLWCLIRRNPHHFPGVRSAKPYTAAVRQAYRERYGRSPEKVPQTDDGRYTDAFSLSDLSWIAEAVKAEQKRQGLPR